MDLNPHAFTAPSSDYELANHVVNTNARLLVMSTAWFTNQRDQKEEKGGQGREDTKETDSEPEWETLEYWISRLKPVIEKGVKVDDEDAKLVIVVIANRMGVESGALVACDLEAVKAPSVENHDDSANNGGWIHAINGPAGLNPSQPSGPALQSSSIYAPIRSSAPSSQPILPQPRPKNTPSFSPWSAITTGPKLVVPGPPSVRYAGTSTVLLLGPNGKIRVCDLMGREEE